MINSGIRGAYRKVAAEPGIIAGVCLLAALAFLCSRPAPPHAVLGAYATDLEGRTPNQRHNARLSAKALDGVLIQPGKVFSFNTLVPGWTADKGFRRAPVSYDGVLVDDYGGGVCQTSTTIYNAALLAGLPILERHAHTFSPSYAPPGRDAAVAYSNVDLRFLNPYPWPLTLHIASQGHMLVCRIMGERAPRSQVLLKGEVLDRFVPPTATIEPGSGIHRSRWRLEGREGLRVALYREFYQQGALSRRELISDNTYRPISRAAWAN